MSLVRTVTLCVESGSWTENAIDLSLAISRAVDASWTSVFVENDLPSSIGELTFVNAINRLSTRPFDRRAMERAIDGEARRFRRVLAARQTADGPRQTTFKGSVADFLARTVQPTDLVVFPSRRGGFGRARLWQHALEATRHGAWAMIEAEAAPEASDIVVLSGQQGSRHLNALTAALGASLGRKVALFGPDASSRRPWLIVTEAAPAAQAGLQRRGGAVLLAPEPLP